MKKDWQSYYWRVYAPKGFEGREAPQAVYCRSKNEADDLQWRIRKWKDDRRHPPRAQIAITAEDQNWIGYLKNRLGTLDVLPAVVDHWLKTAKTVTHPLFVTDLCEEFIAYRKSRPHNQRTLKELAYHARAFRYALGSVLAHEVTPAQIREFLDAADSATMARNRYRALSVILKYAQEQRILVVSPLDEIRRPAGNRTEPAIYTPEEFGRLLRTADSQFPKLLPYVAIAGMAGLRSKELIAMYSNEETLQWSDVLLDKRIISVRPEVAKTTRRKGSDRRYPPIEDSLAEWILPFRKESGPVVEYSESSFRKQFKRLCDAAGVHPAHNALRHSFASYWLARGGKEGVGRLAVIMGNSESVARAHYIESLMPDDADAWFAIRRAAA